MADPIVAAVERLVALHDLGDDNLGDTTPIQLRWHDHAALTEAAGHRTRTAQLWRTWGWL